MTRGDVLSFQMRNLHLLQPIAVVCARTAVVDHLFDFAVGAGVLHVAVFVAASNTVVCLQDESAFDYRVKEVRNFHSPASTRDF